MKQIAIIITIILSSLYTNAQIDAKAKAILDGVSANLKTLKSMKANFTLGISKTKEKKMGIINMKGTKYFVNMAAGAQEIYCDAKTIITYQKASNEATINDIDPTENTLSPTKLFTNFYDKEFVSKYLGDKKIGSALMSIIQLTPTKAKQFTKVELIIDVAKKMIVSGKVYEKNGNIMSYDISNYVPNATLTDLAFVWDAKKHPKVTVVDLR
jgi:outer membrane lipoprotein carrier protein